MGLNFFKRVSESEGPVDPLVAVEAEYRAAEKAYGLAASEVAVFRSQHQNSRRLFQVGDKILRPMNMLGEEDPELSRLCAKLQDALHLRNELLARRAAELKARMR